MPTPQEQRNIDLVIGALTALFARRDLESTRPLWAEDYVQRSLWVPPGKEGLFGMVPSIPLTTRMEYGLVVANDDVVFVHTRTSGHGAPNMVSGDWFRIRDGQFVEHWDVMQDEVSEAQSLSRRSMFGEAALI